MKCPSCQSGDVVRARDSGFTICYNCGCKELTANFLEIGEVDDVELAKDKKNKDLKKWRRGLKGRVVNIYSRQKHYSDKRGHPQPSYSKDELVTWALSQEKYHKMHNIWVLSDYDKSLTPTVDRIDDSVGYTMDNIQLLTWCENKNKHYDDRRVDELWARSKQINKLTMDGKYIETFSSASKAGRSVGSSQGNISSVCRGERNSCKNFKWEYVNG